MKDYEYTIISIYTKTETVTDQYLFTTECALRFICEVVVYKYIYKIQGWGWGWLKIDWSNYTYILGTRDEEI